MVVASEDGCLRDVEVKMVDKGGLLRPPVHPLVTLDDLFDFLLAYPLNVVPISELAFR